MSIFAPLGNTNVTRGHGVQNDVFTSNVTVNCDPRLIVPDTAANIRNGLVKPETAGKIAVEHDLCDLDVRNLTVHGTLIVPGDVILSCTVIKADGAVCCPLTVENTNAQTSAQGGQVGNALCVKGSTLLQPLTDPANDGTTTATVSALLFLDGTLPDGTNFLSGDYMRIDARPLTTGNAIDIDLSTTGSGLTLVPMTGKGIRINKTGSSMENITAGAGAPGGRLLYIDAPIERGANFDVTTTPNTGDAVILGEVRGPLLTDISTFRNTPLSPPGLDGTRQTALWVNCVPDVGSLRINPVGALWIDGGTTFSGNSTNTSGGVASLTNILQPPLLQTAAAPQLFTGIPTTSNGPGIGATVAINVIVLAGVPTIASIVVETPGSGYNVGDLIAIAAAAFGPFNAAQDLIFQLGAENLTGNNGQGHLHSRQVDVDGDTLSPILVGLNIDDKPASAGDEGPNLLFFGQIIGGGFNNPGNSQTPGTVPEPSCGTDVCGIIGFQTQTGTDFAKIAVRYRVPYPEGTIPVVQLTPGEQLGAVIFKNASAAAPAVGQPQYVSVERPDAANPALPLPHEGFVINMTESQGANTGIFTNGENYYIHYKVMAVIE